MDSFTHYPAIRKMKPEKTIVTKWKVENNKKIINKRVIARFRRDKFSDFDNLIQ